MDSQAVKLLKSSGLRATRQRIEILNVLIEACSRLSAEDIYGLLKEKGSSFDLSTVYRTLTALEQYKIIEKSDVPGSTSKFYNISCEGHRHFLICTSCKKSVEIDCCPVEEYTKNVAKQKEFTVTGHTFEIFGICSKCRLKDNCHK